MSMTTVHLMTTIININAPNTVQLCIHVRHLNGKINKNTNRRQKEQIQGILSSHTGYLA